MERDKNIEDAIFYATNRITSILNELSDQPECRTCDGHCCSSFILWGKSDGKPWARKRLMKGFKAPFIPAGDPHIDNDGRIWVEATCSAWVDGKCTNYGNRPSVCRKYPLSAIYKNDALHDECALAERIIKEMELTRRTKKQS